MIKYISSKLFSNVSPSQQDTVALQLLTYICLHNDLQYNYLLILIPFLHPFSPLSLLLFPAEPNKRLSVKISSFFSRKGKSSDTPEALNE